MTTLVVSAVTGVARVLREGGEPQALSEGGRLHAGDVVEVGIGGSVALTRGTSSALEVRTARKVNAQVRLDAPDRIHVDAGEVLVTSAEDAPITVGSEGITASGQGIYRFDRSLSLRVGVYEGTAIVGAPSGELRLQRLRQGVIAGRVLPRSSDPLQVEPGDEWDRRFLGDVIDLDRTLDAHARGYEAEFGRRMGPASTLRSIVDGRPLGFIRAHLATHDSGDVLIGLVLALLIEQAGGRLGQAFRELMTLSDAGASWGLLAYENDVEARALIEALVRAIGLRTGDVRPGTSVTQPPSTGGPGGGGTGPTPGPSPSRSPRPRPSPSPSPSPSDPSPSPSPSPTESSCVLPPPLCDQL